jgi:hypothetical protein
MAGASISPQLGSLIENIVLNLNFDCILDDLPPRLLAIYRLIYTSTILQVLAKGLVHARHAFALLASTRWEGLAHFEFALPKSRNVVEKWFIAEWLLQKVFHARHKNVLHHFPLFLVSAHAPA